MGQWPAVVLVCGHAVAHGIIQHIEGNNPNLQFHDPLLTGGRQQIRELLARQLQRRVQRIGAAAQRNQGCRQHRGT